MKVRIKLVTIAIMIAFSSIQLKGQITGKELNYDKIKEIAPAVQIYFDMNKSDVKKTELVKLDKLIKDLKGKDKFRVIVTGHTDSTGSDEYNLKLSQKRAGEVFDYLAESGLDDELMEVGFFGRSKPRPVAGASAEEKKSMYRRVEILIIEPPKPVEKPKMADTCNRDTVLQLSKDMSIKMNICEWRRLCYGKPSCVSITKLTSVEEIITSGVPLADKKGDGKIWSGIYDIKLPGDSCFSEAISLTYLLDKEVYKRATKIEALVATDENVLDRMRMRSGRLRVSKSKTDIVVDLPIECPGRQLHASKMGKSKETCFKDKTRKIEQIYVTSDAPTTILPARKVGNKFYVNYSNVPEAKIWILTTDGEWISNVDLNTIKRAKEGELAKGYKLKKRHLVMGS